jgi:hypothetical protein
MASSSFLYIGLPTSTGDSWSHFEKYFQIRLPQSSRNFREYFIFSSNTDVTDAWSYASTPPYIVAQIEHGDKYTFDVIGSEKPESLC